MEIEFVMMFKNPSNDFVQETSSPLSWLWVFLFGFLYFAVKGIWTHAVANFILVICTVVLGILFSVSAPVDGFPIGPFSFKNL